ncbi:Open rectifier potassium channel protein 1 [Pseudolycoriella hygida]|uniref:Open rectifier potassium channel protein 1 n=1 Tax=Pseudolycoriella hygida TaxID=35572 RepID=A0A9Q0N823_9DIPT|nr:Open rectifier potassium channel protein 1 [Pseudolycoriella hygida]
MSPKQWLSLLCFYVLYLLLGTVVFHHFEHKRELEDRAILLRNRIKVNELLVEFASPDDLTIQNEILNKVSNYCGRPVTNHTLDEYPNDYKWTFYHSFWFSFIVCSTLGYGNSSPHDEPGQAFLIFYGLIGLPLNGFVLAYLGEYFSKTFIGIYNKYKGYEYDPTQHHAAIRKVGMISRILMFLLPGIAFFIFLPAFLFSYFENWSYVTSVYYAFITLTTIGFGDYVPTYQNGQARKFGAYFTFYQIFIIFWNVIGVGYFIMIIGFIAKGMQSKRIARLEHQLSVNIKTTQHRIWEEVRKDLSFLRRLLNEINLMKFQPVYTDSAEKIPYKSRPRSLSVPDLEIYQTEVPRVARKRTYSENYVKPLHSSTTTLNRGQSDGDLSRIDKKETFKSLDGSNLLQTKDLLSNIVAALGSVQLMNEINFSSSQICTSERSGSLSLSHSDDSCSFRRARQRALSDFYIPRRDSSKESHELEETSDPQIDEYLKNKTRHFSIASTLPSKPTKFLEANRRNTFRIPGGGIYGSFIRKVNQFKAKVMERDGKRNSVLSIDPPICLNESPKRRGSRLSITPRAAEQMEILEKTTIADLIRAIDEIQVKSNNSSQTPLLADYRGSFRTKIAGVKDPANYSRRGSLRPISGYTTVFMSQKSQLTSPNPIKKSLSLVSKSPSQKLQRTFSLCPSPLAMSSPRTRYGRTHSEAPIITIQPPDVTTQNVLWPTESRVTDRAVYELRTRNRLKRADSK